MSTTKPKYNAASSCSSILHVATKGGRNKSSMDPGYLSENKLWQWMWDQRHEEFTVSFRGCRYYRRKWSVHKDDFNGDSKTIKPHYLLQNLYSGILISSGLCHIVGQKYNIFGAKDAFFVFFCKCSVHLFCKLMILHIGSVTTSLLFVLQLYISYSAGFILLLYCWLNNPVSSRESLKFNLFLLCTGCILM